MFLSEFECGLRRFGLAFPGAEYAPGCRRQPANPDTRGVQRIRPTDCRRRSGGAGLELRISPRDLASQPIPEGDCLLVGEDLRDIFSVPQYAAGFQVL